MIAEQTRTVTFQGITYDATHGGPFDRGSADSWYGRFPSPHKYPNGTGNKPRIEGHDMTLAEMKAYYKGYDYNEQFGGKKDYD